MAINSLSAASHGFSGLVSGIDTQEVVKKLLSGTQARMDKVGQAKSALQFKQSMYSDVAGQLRKLQDNYLRFSSKNNLLSNSFYNAMNTKVNSPAGVNPAFSVTASSGAKAGTTVVNSIDSLASAFTLTNKNKASSAMEGTLSVGAAESLLASYKGPDATLNITVGDKTVSIANAPQEFAGMSATEVAKKMNDAFADGGVEAEARFVNNKLTIVAKDSTAEIKITGNTAEGAENKTLAMQMFGNVASLSGTGTLSSTVNTDNYQPGFVMTVDGRQQTIRLDLNALEEYTKLGNNSTDLVKNINDQLQKAFGNSVKATVEGGKISFASPSTTNSQQFSITGSLQVMDTLGIKTGTSNKLNTSMPLSSLNFKTPLEGSQFTFKLNGVEFSYSSGTSLNTVMNDIEKSNAGVKVSYDSINDRFSIENTNTGAGNDKIEWSQSEGNLLSALFGVAGSGAATGSKVNKTIEGAALSTEDIAKFADGGKFTFNVNGVNRTITIDKKKDETPYSMQELADEINKGLKSAYGSLGDGTQVVNLSVKDGAFIMKANSPETVVKMVDTSDSNINLGFTSGDSTRVTNGGDAVSKGTGIKFGAGASIDVTVNGVKQSITQDDLDLNNKSFDEIASLIQGKLGPGAKVIFDSKDSTFRISGVEGDTSISINQGTGSTGLNQLFGTDKLTFNQAATANVENDSDFGRKPGTNAILTINGQPIERSSNTFTIDGLTFILNSTTQKLDNQGNPTTEHHPATTITTTRDTEKVYEGISEFLKMYNETIDYINKLYRADPSYKNYPPLTSAQKAAMSETEIKNWEEKSKEGLLRSDPQLEKVLQAMRGSMNAKPDGSGISIYDLGIKSTTDGKFSPLSEADLKAAIEKDPEALRHLFAGTEGTMDKLNSAINNALVISTTSQGYMTQVAGTTSLDSNSKIFKQIKEIDKQLESLEKRYSSEYNRYWKQFNAMEQMIQNMNTQSAWLSQQFA